MFDDAQEMDVIFNVALYSWDTILEELVYAYIFSVTESMPLTMGLPGLPVCILCNM